MIRAFENGEAQGDSPLSEEPHRLHQEMQMLFVAGAIVVLAALVLVQRLQVGNGANDSSLGWMSQRWLDEHRASHLR